MARPARNREMTTACHSKTRKVNPPAVCVLSLAGVWGLCVNTYSSDKCKCRVILLKYMLIKPQDPTIDNFDRRKKRETEAVPGAKDDMVHVFQFTSI